MAQLVICLGGAPCVWDDLEDAVKLCKAARVRYAIAACNDAGVDYPGRLAAWCTLHPEKFGDWQRARARRGGNTDYVSASHKNAPMARIDLIQPELWHGTSGLYVCRIALMELNYMLAIACGMPMDGAGHYFDPDSVAWKEGQPYKRGWLEAHDQQELAGKIRSMSGWTRELLGPPDMDWIHQSCNTY